MADPPVSPSATDAEDAEDAEDVEAGRGDAWGEMKPNSIGKTIGKP